MLGAGLQWEVSNRALEALQNTKDAKGRTIEVCKIRLPPPLFRTYKEAEGLAVSPAALVASPRWNCDFARDHGSSSCFEHYP